MSISKLEWRPIIRYSVLVVLVGACIFQFQLAVRDGLQLARSKAIVNWRMEPIYRGADETYGAEFADFIRFLRTTLPEGAPVLLVPGTENRQVFDKYFMQYFLFPRRLRLCQESQFRECVESYDSRQIFLVYGNGVPMFDVPGYHAEAIEFSDQLGLLAVEES